MTWVRLGDQFFDECAVEGLSDRAVRTHCEGIGWLCRLESSDLIVREKMLRRFAGTDDPEAAMAELVTVGFWRSVPGGWVLVHHAETTRQSLAYQLGKRERDRVDQRNKRERDRAKAQKKAPLDEVGSGRPVSADTDTDVSADVAATLTNYLTTADNEAAEVGRDPWSADDPWAGPNRSEVSRDW